MTPDHDGEQRHCFGPQRGTDALPANQGTDSPSAQRGCRWIVRPLPRPAAASRLFCFPFAGGAASTYRLWPAGLPQSVELCALAYPGRAQRLREPAIDSMPAIVSAIVEAVLPLLDKPFSFFGHSMGAIVATEVARALQARGVALPAHLFVAARRPAHMQTDEPLLHALPNDQLVSELRRRYGGIPDEVLEHKELLELLLPSMRADLKALETHLPAQRPALSCPITAYGGSADTRVPRGQLDAWHAETLADFRVREFEGGHFFIESSREQLLTDLSATLDASVPRSPRTGGPERFW
jgi:medium-chain acyl-[acyl-carrier-protein] hydrolase